MKIYKCVCLFLIASLATLPSITTNAHVASKDQAPSQQHLAKAKKPPVRVKKPSQGRTSCTRVRGDNEELTNETISVGIKAFTAFLKMPFYSYDPSLVSNLLVCKIIEPPTNKNFRSTYALPDNSSFLNAKITAYLDGKQAASINISRGEADTLEFNITDAKSYAIQVDIAWDNKDNKDYVYQVTE
jgi:hypothetical protein